MTVPRRAPLLVVLSILMLAALPARGEPGVPARVPPPEDFPGLWKQATSAFPELRRFRPLADDDRTLGALLAWAGPRGRAVVYDEDCRPIRVTRGEAALAGERVLRSVTRGRTRQVETDEVHFGGSRTVLGSSTVTYERDGRGRWVETGSGACGCADYPRGTLARVTRDAAWYSTAVVTVRVECGGTATETSPCRDGDGTQTCTRCRGVRVRTEAVGGGAAGLSVGSASTTRGGGPAVDCTRPCPPDDHRALIERLAPALEGRTFLDTSEPLGRPALFRTLERCRQGR